MAKRPPKSKEKCGPKPQTLRIKGNWEDAVAASLTKKRPADGWPKEEGHPGRKERDRCRLEIEKLCKEKGLTLEGLEAWSKRDGHGLGKGMVVQLRKMLAEKSSG